MEIATRRDNVHLTDHGHQPALTKPKQHTLQTAKPVGGHGLTLTRHSGLCANERGDGFADVRSGWGQDTPFQMDVFWLTVTGMVPKGGPRDDTCTRLSIIHHLY
jgi:hypothetical protein